MPVLMYKGIPYGEGTNTLDGLKDVDISNLSDGDVLKYNSSTGKFENGTGGDGSQFQPVIYSEEEREIGVWIDGKPLYEKTQYISALPSSVGDWVNYPHGISNFDRLISVSATAYNSDVPQQLNIPHVSATIGVSPSAPQITISVSDTNIAFIVGQDRSSWEAYVTIQYTKTTDAPGSGTWTPQGVPAVHYSTTEHVVGTWIDGSTVYEKTIVLDSELQINARSWEATSEPNSGMDTLVDVVALSSTGTVYVVYAAIDTGDYIRLFNVRDNAEIRVKIFTIRYTKTSA